MIERAGNWSAKGATVVFGAGHVVAITTDFTCVKVLVVAVTNRLASDVLNISSPAWGGVEIVTLVASQAVGIIWCAGRRQR